MIASVEHPLRVASLRGDCRERSNRGDINKSPRPTIRGEAFYVSATAEINQLPLLAFQRQGASAAKPSGGVSFLGSDGVDASLEWCSTPPLWHIDADGGVHPIRTVSHSSPPPSAIMLFLSSRNSSACSATTSFSSRDSRRRSLTSPGRRRPRRIASKTPLARLQELLRPGIIQALGDAFASAQFRDAVLTAQTVQQNTDFLLGGILTARRPANVFYDLLGRQFRGSDFWLISLLDRYDEPEILLSSTRACI